MKNFHFLTLLFLIACAPYSRGQAFQTIKGTVVDQQSEMPVIGAAVELLSVEPLRGTMTDLDGRFSIAGVPVGRHNLRVSYLGYESVTIPNVLVTAGKETVLNIGLEESVLEMNEVVVTGRVEKGKANNEMATISARSFNLEEVTRF